jgi:hypothetical protein
VDGVGVGRDASRPQLFVHEQLALEARVDNKPTADVVVWSVLSLIALLGGIGLLFAAFGRCSRFRPSGLRLPSSRVP